jgi:2-beta-glucuronyltransferase
MKTVVLVTGHYLTSDRRAGFHWLADAFRADGWRVVFLTAGVSWLLWLRRLDYRLQYPLIRERNRVVWKAPDLASYVWLTPWHPSHVPIPGGDRLAAPLFRRYGSLRLGAVERLLEKASLFVYDSTPGLMLADRLRARHPRARHVYRVSDDMRLLGYHPVVIEAEDRTAGAMDLVSVPSRALCAQFAGLTNVTLQPHGIDTAAFDACHADPYDRGVAFNAVFVGNSHLDRSFLDAAATRFAEARFHVIGAFEPGPHHGNITWHGEMPFARTLPYIIHADIGLNIREYGVGAESLTDSLKVLQYTYCRLPIIAPDFLKSHRPHVVCYRPGDAASVAASVHAALRIDRASIDRSSLRSWQALARELAGEAL